MSIPFQVSYPFGAFRAQQDYIVADTVHDIMSLILKDIILEKWEYKSKDFEYISQSIQKEAKEIVGNISTYKKEWAKGEGREIP